MQISEIRGTVARTFLWQDAAWCIDVFLSSRVSEDANSIASLLMMSTSARVAYEGRRIIQHRSPVVGAPDLARKLSTSESEGVTKARHAAKLLDDNKKSLDDFLSDMRRYQDAHHRTMRGDAPLAFDWLVQELGVTEYDGHVVLATIPHQIRFQILDRNEDAINASMLAFGEAIGTDLSVFFHLAGPVTVPPATLDATALTKVISNDHYVQEFLLTRYGSDLDDAGKLLVLLVEAELNTLVHLMLPRLSQGHSDAVLRTAMITVWHAISSLRVLVSSRPEATDAVQTELREHLWSTSATTFLSPKNKQIRNTFVHYLPPDVPLDPTMPLFGVVEALNPEMDLDALVTLTLRLATETSELVEAWRNTKT